MPTLIADNDNNEKKQTCHVATNLKLQTITPDDPVTITHKCVCVILFRTANVKITQSK